MRRPQIYISSFFRSATADALPPNVQRWSAAVYPPRGFEALPKANWTDIRDESDKWIRPREFIGTSNPPAAYREALYKLYLGRIEEARRWYSRLEGDVALLCWCPYDRAARRQMTQWGSFICHTGVLGEFLHTEFSAAVWYDADRLRMTVLTQGIKQ